MISAQLERNPKEGVEGVRKERVIGGRSYLWVICDGILARLNHYSLIAWFNLHANRLLKEIEIVGGKWNLGWNRITAYLMANRREKMGKVGHKRLSRCHHSIFPFAISIIPLFPFRNANA